jgi:predicted secreted protein
MSITTAVAIFFLIWWVALFAVLPWGVRSQHEDGADAGPIAPSLDLGADSGMDRSMAPGTDPGAPSNFRLGRTLLWTTLVAGVIYAACYVIYVEHLVTIDGLMAPFAGTKSQ